MRAEKMRDMNLVALKTILSEMNKLSDEGSDHQRRKTQRAKKELLRNVLCELACSIFPNQSDELLRPPASPSPSASSNAAKSEPADAADDVELTPGACLACSVRGKAVAMTPSSSNASDASSMASIASAGGAKIAANSCACCGCEVCRGTQKHRAVSCRGCDSWIHVSCRPSLLLLRNDVVAELAQRFQINDPSAFIRSPLLLRKLSPETLRLTDWRCDDCADEELDSKHGGGGGDGNRGLKRSATDDVEETATSGIQQQFPSRSGSSSPQPPPKAISPTMELEREEKLCLSLGKRYKATTTRIASMVDSIVSPFESV